ncbi:2-oxoacid:acceptor oxidoreductase subunit alpha [Guggenheimella bovis]
MENKYQLMQGNEAVVQGALYAGYTFYAGYPITPSTEIAELSALYLPRKGGRFIQMEDEIGGIAAAIGASIAGSKSMTATSGPGFSLKQENIGYAAIAQVPLVIVDVMRGGPSTGLPTQSAQGDVYQSRYGSHGDYPMIVLSPSSVTETFHLTVRAFNLAEKYRTPVILLTDEVIGHMRERIQIPEKGEIEIIDRVRPQKGDNRLTYEVKEGEIVPPMAEFGTGFHTHTTGLFYNETGFPSNSVDNAKKLLEQLLNKVENNRKDIVQTDSYELDDAEVAIVTFGSTARVAKSAIKLLRSKGVKAGMLRAITVWPSPEEEIRELSKRVKHIIVCEMNYGQYTHEVERIVFGNCPVTHLGRSNGNILTPTEICEFVEGVL